PDLSSRPPPRSPPFPYTTLFRSRAVATCPFSPRALSFGTGPYPPGARAVSRIAFLVAACAALGGCNFPGTSPAGGPPAPGSPDRSEEHTSELQSRFDLVCRLLLE